MNYLEWNTKIAEHFFSHDKAGRKIYLFVTQELIEQFGQPQGIGFSNFVEAVKAGPAIGAPSRRRNRTIGPGRGHSPLHLHL